MKQYPLTDLLRVRKVRLDVAMADFLGEQHKADIIKKQCADLKEELRRYRQHKHEKEQQLFDEIHTKVMPRHELDLYRASTQFLREKGISMEMEVLDTEKKVDMAVEKVEKARSRTVAAEREYEKIVQHRLSWSEEMRLEQERASEKELEEFLIRKKERRDE